ncbi:phosphate ABC transporter substrate-binding protein [Blastopirellula sp. JC732]|uniref:Phosphate-binding protein n=1 Tax=Blastopirellula sediminis TaxID=2894196 RepID=A0A9X1SHK7_9BACT|nr:phosphate ABC transporter substrate-binding protein [Blastopirellula sediminis]MCC9606767.1 phosphate ABC transporter substrate-binding protein [Blastopirellula sediminis]MCC9629936.1 phosphate ABC transporter substrate-binding protein [Blastopirellula sediminis]
MTRRSTLLWIALITFCAGQTAVAQTQVDPNLPKYKPQQGISGTISSMGSDTMNNLMALWAKRFNDFYPNVKIEIEGKGSSTAPAALTEGRATFGPMSRPMTKAEIDKFEKRHQYKPTQLGTSIDMLAVYVHNNNPILGLSFEDLDGIFSSTRKSGSADLRTWGQVGLGGNLAKERISLYGRSASSGTYGYFKEKALFKGDYRDSVQEQPGSAAVIQAVANDPVGIGYSGVGFKNPGVRTVPISKDGGPFIAPTLENVSKYPLTRFLLIGVNYNGKQLDPLQREFIKFIYSQEGQAEVVKDGYLPLSAVQAKRQLSLVKITFEDY